MRKTSNAYSDYETLEIVLNINQMNIQNKHRTRTSSLTGYVPYPSNSEVDNIVGSLKFLEKPSITSDLFKIALIIIDLVWRSLIIALTFTSTSLLSTFAFYILNKNNENDKQAAFGIYLMMRCLLYSSFFYGAALKMSLAASQSIGRGDDFAQSKKFLTQATLMYIFYMLIAYLPYLFFSRQVLRLLGISTFIASGYYDIAWKALLGDFFDCVQLFLMQFCCSQRIESIFSLLTWINLATSVCLILVLDLIYGLSLDGWIIGRTAFYFMNAAAFFFIYMTQTDKDSRGFCSIPVAMKNFNLFLIDGLTYWLGNMMEFISWETGVIFSTRTHDTTQIAAFGSMMNVSYIMCDTSMGFLNISRTRVNYLLGSTLPKAAKKMGVLSLVSCLVPGTVFSILLYCFKDNVSMIYASNHLEEKMYLIKLFSIYAFFMSIDIIVSLLTALMRTANLVIFSSVVFLVVAVGGNTAICSYLYQTDRLTVIAILLSMYATLASACVICTIKLFSIDWSHIELVAAD